MKKTHYLSVIILLASFGLFALVNSCRKYIEEPEPVITELICDKNIRGGCLDQWTMVDDGYGNKNLDPLGGYLKSLNYLATLPAAAGGPGPQTADSTSDSYEGSHAAVLTTKVFSPMGEPILIPGLLGTDSLDIPNATIRVGKPYNLRPEKFRGYYKYEPVGGDSAMVSILLSKYNSVAGKRDTLGLAREIFKNTVTEYTFIDLNINYFNLTETPDTLTLLICSSAAVNFNDLMDCKGQVGSKMWIDEIFFIMP